MTFATEWGQFRYKQAPQSYLSSGNSYSKYTDAILENCPSISAKKDFEKIVDDVITFVASKEKIIEMIQIGVFSFDLDIETCLSTDYSKDGMGWILQQKTCLCE